MKSIIKKETETEDTSVRHRPVDPACMVQDFLTCYPMKHKNCGLAVIFAHNTFAVPNENLKPRKGNDVDCKMLTESLEGLGFNIQIHKDMPLDDIIRITKEVASMDHSKSNCLLFAVLSHGEDDGVVYAQDSSYELSNLWLPFTDDQCQTLVGKPKIFIFQACRGGNTDSGVKVEKDGAAKFSTPINKDFLFAFATIPGFVSFRNPQSGSWFIRALCDELKENGQKYHMLTLLTFVIQKVAYEYESNTPMDPDYHLKKQTPCIVTTLTKLLVFKNV